VSSREDTHPPNLFINQKIYSLDVRCPFLKKKKEDVVAQKLRPLADATPGFESGFTHNSLLNEPGNNDCV
jgi:hypothetical protein